MWDGAMWEAEWEKKAITKKQANICNKEEFGGDSFVLEGERDMIFQVQLKNI